MFAASFAAMAKLARTASVVFLLAIPCSANAVSAAEQIARAFFAFHFPLTTASLQSTFTVIGSVRNQAGQSVSGVRVSIIDENFQPIYTAFVDAGGRFTLKGVKQGKFTIRIETIGTPYEEASQTLELQALRQFGGNEDMMVDFVLKYKKGEGPPVRTTPVFAQNVPKAARTEFEHGANNLKGNKTEPGIASMKKAIEIFPDYFDALEMLGLEYVKSSQYEAALPVLTHATEINKRAPRSLYALGVACLKLNRLPESIEWLEKSAQIDSSSANIHMMLGLAYGNSGTLDKSEAAFKKALQFGGPAAAEAHYYLTGLYNKQERYREAWQELELFLKEAKNVKDPTQIKAMIANLKEKEKTQAAQPATPIASDSQSATAALSLSNSAGLSDPAGPVGERTSPAPAEPKPAANAATIGPVPPLPPEYVELLRLTDDNGATLHKQLLDYTYQLKKTHRVLNERGNSTYTQEQVFEAYPIRGEHVLITLSRNGIPSRTITDERKHAAKQLEEAERKRASEKPAEENSNGEADGYVSAGVTGVYQGKVGYVSINISTILRSCEFFSPRVEKLGGREMVIINYRHRAGTKLASNHNYIAGLVGTVWIDQADKVVTRLEGWPASAAAFDLVQATAPQDEAALIYQQTRLADGVWFPKVIRMNAGGRIDLFDGLNWDVVFEFSNYQRFNTSGSEKLNNPETQKP